MQEEGCQRPLAGACEEWHSSSGFGLARSKTLAMFPDGGRPEEGGACESMRLSPCVLVQPDGWARGEREGYGEPCDVTSLSLKIKPSLLVQRRLVQRRRERHRRVALERLRMI